MKPIYDLCLLPGLEAKAVNKEGRQEDLTLGQTETQNPNTHTHTHTHTPSQQGRSSERK